MQDQPEGTFGAHKPRDLAFAQNPAGGGLPRPRDLVENKRLQIDVKVR